LKSLLAGHGTTGAACRDRSARIVAPRRSDKRERTTPKPLYFNPDRKS
jgi:hypothetical protein